MILVLALGMTVLAGLVVSGAFAVASPARSRRAGNASVLGGGGPLVGLAGAALVVVLLGAVAMAMIGVGGGEGGDAGEHDVRPAATTATTVASTAPRSTPARPVVPDSIEGPEVRLEAIDRDGFAAGAPVVSQLPRRSVLRITASGFEPNASGRVEQCAPSSCTNPFPVLFDETGSARLQYLVRDTIAVAGGTVSTCGADDPPCVVRLRTGADAAFLTTVFGGAAPAPRRVSVEPSSRDLAHRAPVTVTARGFPPGSRVHATLCAAPDTAGPRRCGAPSPVAPFTIGADGTGRTILVIRGDRVGSDGIRCGRRVPCGVVVREAASELPAPVVPVAFAAGTTARYEAARVAIGVALASVLLTIALFLVRRTDWRKPTEADTPELDGAVLLDL